MKLQMKWLSTLNQQLQRWKEKESEELPQNHNSNNFIINMHALLTLKKKTYLKYRSDPTWSNKKTTFCEVAISNEFIQCESYKTI